MICHNRAYVRLRRGDADRRILRRSRRRVATTIRRSRSSSSCRRRPPASATSCRACSRRSSAKPEIPATIVVENRPGGNGVLAYDAVAKAPPDGTMLLMGNHAGLAMNPHLAKSLPYDPFKSFAPIILLVTVPNILVVHPSVPANSLKELIAYAKANPGKLSYASQGTGASGHIAAELLKLHAGIDIVHVPYRGAAPAAQDLAAGHVSMMFDVVSLALPQITAGRVRPLAVARRSASRCCPTCRP